MYDLVMKWISSKFRFKIIFFRFYFWQLKNPSVFVTEGNLFTTERFNCKTFDICVSIGKLFNFKLEFYPSLTELDNNMNPLNIETSQPLFDILQNLPFTEQLNTHNLHVEFQYFLNYISEAARSLCKSCNDSVLDPNSANINSFFIIKLKSLSMMRKSSVHHYTDFCHFV